MSEFDFGAMMQQAQELQAKVARAQDEARQRTVEGAAGGGMVTVTMTGGLEMRRVKIDPAALAAGGPQDLAMVEDLVAAATNQAIQKAQALAAEAVREALGPLAHLAGGGMPGLF